MLNQTKLAEAGSQFWNKNILASGKNKFAFASTLSVYVYEIIDNKGLSVGLSKILSDFTNTITSIEWNPKEDTQLATASEAGDVYIWSIRSERPKIYVELDNTVATMLHWNPVNTNNLLFVLKSGEVKYLKINEREIEKIDYLGGTNPVVAKWHPTNGEIIFIGYKNGVTEFYNHTEKRFLSKYQYTSPVEDLAWYKGENYALVWYADGTMNVFEQDFNEPRSTFERQSAGIHSLMWIDNKSGDFITTSKTVGALKIWNVAQKLPKKMVKIVSSGISDTHVSPGAGRSIFPLSIIPIQEYSNLVLIACTNGSIALFNIEKKKIEFQTEPGHSETIFDIEFKPADKNILASCSYDGSIKIWDAPSMKMVLSIHISKKKGDIGHTTQQSAGGDNTIYGLSWSPDSDEIAWICGKGNVKIFNTKKGILKHDIKPGDKGFRIAWNQLNSRYILSSANDGNAYLLMFDDNDDFGVKKAYDHNGQAVFGVSWSRFESTKFATGCDDGIVRVFDFANGFKDNAVIKLEGHQKRVFNIVWHPHSPNILASGSNDNTIKVWNIDDKSWVTLTGHTKYVRGIVWNNEIPWFLASGSWDATIRLWDTRIGTCITVLNDHHADIYALDAHPDRPFVYVSCSRDNSIRFWNSEGILNSFKIHSILRYDSSELVDDMNELMIMPNTAKPEETYISSVTKMWGKKGKSLFENIHYGTKENDLDQMMEIFDFFSLYDGQNEFWDMMKVIIKESPGSLHNRVLHISDISSAVESHAKELVRSKSLKIKGNFGK